MNTSLCHKVGISITDQLGPVATADNVSLLVSETCLARVHIHEYLGGFDFLESKWAFQWEAMLGETWLNAHMGFAFRASPSYNLTRQVKRILIVKQHMVLAWLQVKRALKKVAITCRWNSIWMKMRSIVSRLSYSFYISVTLWATPTHAWLCTQPFSPPWIPQHPLTITLQYPWHI